MYSSNFSIEASNEEVTLDDFDFIHLTLYDIHGKAKGRMVSSESMESVKEGSVGLYAGFLYIGIRSELNFDKTYTEDPDGNRYLRPIMSTLRRCQSSSRGKYRVGEVLCYLSFQDGTVDQTVPREVALTQLEVLEKEFGLTLKSSFEIEFIIKDKESKEYFGHKNQFPSKTVLECCNDVLMEFAKDMKEGGVVFQTISVEGGPGQFEVTLRVEEGIRTADNVAKFKSSSIAFMESKGLERVFMTQPDLDPSASNGFDFNLSLWTHDGVNSLLDATQPNKLSELGQHFVAGLVEHTSALTALCCPTVNCYRCVGRPWFPSFANWAVQDRRATYRLKVDPGNKNIYLENRLPSSACNPYLVVAATLAAGMDGIRRKLPLPSPRDETVHLPKRLEDALAALEADEILVTALGKEMVERFLYTKRVIELKFFDELGQMTDEQKFEKEKEYYYSYL